jgi:hypothetical protein
MSQLTESLEHAHAASTDLENLHDVHDGGNENVLQGQDQESSGNSNNNDQVFSNSNSNEPQDFLSAPQSVPVIGCAVKAQKFVSTLNAQRPVTVNCSSGCAINVAETEKGWQVYGLGPFRYDSSICKAAQVAGVIGEDGGVVTLLFHGQEADFVPYGAIMETSFCFKGMKKGCHFTRITKPPGSNRYRKYNYCPESNATASPMAEIASSASSCSDTYPRSSCLLYKRYGYCSGRYVSWMKRYCSATCGYCSTSPPTRLSLSCGRKVAKMQISIVIDCTGSMSSVLEATRNQVVQMADNLGTISSRLELAFMCFRDLSDGTRRFEKYPANDTFTTSPSSIKTNAAKMRASGGGDAPEDVFGGVKESMKLPWDSTAIKFMLLISQDTDGGRSGGASAQCTQMRDVAEKGIHLVFGRITSRTDGMIARWKRCYDDKTTGFSLDSVTVSKSDTGSIATTMAKKICATVAKTSPPSLAPTPMPTTTPTEPPTSSPTEHPTAAPTTMQPSSEPTTIPPTEMPTAAPTRQPTELPTAAPTETPTIMPTTLPPTTAAPSHLPTNAPTAAPCIPRPKSV